MPICRVAFVCGFLLVAAAAQTQADEVDDLLSGKSFTLQEDTATPPSRPIVAEPEFGLAPLVEGQPWAISVEQPTGRHFSAPTPAPQTERKPAPTAVSFVPEPSAIALAVLALMYFLVFFRRRHLA